MVGSTSAPQLPGYRDLAPLGRGGYSEVYSAYQDQFDRWVAVKVLTFALTDDRAQRRFLRECRVAGRLSAHPNIVTVYDAGLSPDGRPYISMELFDRGSIADRLRSGGPFGVPDALRIAIGLAGALETAHRAGVVHRDVKPANVLLTSYGQPALTDFGLSILAERQEVSVGVDALTPYHAPPEVLERTTVTPTSDVYSLASTTYAMLAGRAPHQQGGDQDTMASLLLRILQVDVPPIEREDVPGSLDAALRSALARDAHVRTPSALAFAHALHQVQAELGLEMTQLIVMDAPQNSEVPGPPGALVDPSPAGLTVPTDSPGPAVGPEVTLGYGAARPGEATVDRPAAAGTGRPGEGTVDRPAVAGTATGGPRESGTMPPVAGPGPAWPFAEPAADALAATAGPGDPADSGTPPAAGRPMAASFADVPGAPPGAAPFGPAAPGLDTAAPPGAAPSGPAAPGLDTAAPPGADSPAAAAFAGRPDTGLAPDTPGPGAGVPPRSPPSGPPGSGDGPGRPAPPGPGWPSPFLAGTGGPLDGDETVHRDVIRRASAAQPPPERPSRPRRRLLVAAVALVLAGAGTGAFLVLRDDEERADPDRTTTTSTTTEGRPTVLERPRDLKANENPAGVHLTWEGDNAEQYVVLVMSEAEQPQFMPPRLGASYLVPSTALRPDVGYCFAVALLSTLNDVQSDQAAEAFSRPTCIRGAAEDTVLTE